MKRTTLFAGIGEDEIGGMLSCLGARIATYTKGEYVLHLGEHLGELGLVAEGSLRLQKEDFWGNRFLLRHLSAGEMFGEAYLSPESGPLMHDVIAAENATVFFFDVARLTTTCSSACRFHTTVVQNLFFALSEKNKELVKKLEHMSKRSTREKLLSFLSEVAMAKNSSTFTIPLNRQELADYLSVDRSAMSGELSKMQREGILKFEKNRFELLERRNHGI